MDKIRDINKYIATVKGNEDFFKSYYYHSLIDLNLAKLDSIIKNGLLSKQLIQQKNLPSLYTHFEGIILPEHLSTLPISQVNCLPDDLSCYTKSYLNHWIGCMQRYFNITLPQETIKDIKTSYEQLWDILEEYENPDRWVQSAIRTQRSQYGKDLKDVLANILQNLWAKKFDISNPTYMDVLMKVNNSQLPIYEIKQKTLKRVI